MIHRTSARLVVGLTIGFAALLAVSANTAWAQRCGTGMRGVPGRGIAALRPLARGVIAYREVAPAPTETIGGDPVQVHVTEHFRVIWGDAVPPNDPHWTDPDGDGVPVWVDELAKALEYAYEVQTDEGFPEPYGVSAYYLDVYIGNTGVRIYDATTRQWQTLSIGANFYAYTEIDPRLGVAWFVFNDDFSAYTRNELSVLRATAAHELFHAVQRAMDYPWDDSLLIPDSRWVGEAWWLEASATWAEEVTVPEIDDYVVYANEFLASPHLPLASTDGLREYGAAVFAGYLWELYGGTALFRDVFENAYASQLEPALRDALILHGAGGQAADVLENVVAGFWVEAAAPSTTIWEDAEAFRGARLLATATQFPVTVYPGSFDQPGRLGANLIRVPATLLPTVVGMDWLTPGSEWRIAVLGFGGGRVEVYSPRAGVPLQGVGTGGSGWAYCAVVNTSPVAGTDQYVLEMGGDGVIDDGVQWRIPPTVPQPTPDASGDGSGGCFLGSLRSGE